MTTKAVLELAKQALESTYPTKALCLRSCTGCQGRVFQGPETETKPGDRYNLKYREIKYNCTCKGKAPLGPDWTQVNTFLSHETIQHAIAEIDYQLFLLGRKDAT
jgi:hypothetical protein